MPNIKSNKGYLDNKIPFPDKPCIPMDLDLKLQILENRLVPKDLNSIDPLESAATDNHYLYLFDVNSKKPYRLKVNSVSIASLKAGEGIHINPEDQTISIDSIILGRISDLEEVTEDLSSRINTLETNSATKTELETAITTIDATKATKEEVNTLASQKQDVINDLVTIREGAALGATALQSVPGEYITDSELANELALYGATLSLAVDPTTFIVTAQLKNQAGTVISTQTIDLPLEQVVVSGEYDSINKKIVLTLKDGSKINIPVGDLVSGLQTEITTQNKLSADLVDDTNATNKFVTANEKALISGAAQQSDLATVATTGDYDDLINKPVVPEGVSGTNDGTNWTSLTIGNDTYNLYQGSAHGVDYIIDNTAGNKTINLEDCKAYTLTSDAITSITINIPNVITAGYIAEVNFKGYVQPANLTVNSTLPIHYIILGVDRPDISYSLNCQASLLFSFDGAYLSCFVSEISIS